VLRKPGREKKEMKRKNLAAEEIKTGIKASAGVKTRA
jgi:hypothetical protein